MISTTRFLIFFLFTCCFAVAQQTTNYTTADGLSNNAIRALFVDANSDLWIGTENGVSRFENGTFTNLILPKNINNTSCWDIAQQTNGTMWFASYGGGIYSFDGKKYTLFDQKNGLPSNRTRKLLCHNNKMIIGTELGIALLDLRTKKIEVPKGIEPHFGVFIVTDLFIYKNEIYFSALNEGLYKIIYKNGIPEIQIVQKQTNCYSIGIFNNAIYCSNKGFINNFNLGSISNKKPNYSTFGKSIVWDYAKNSQSELFATAWGIFDESGGLYKIENNKMIDVSNQYNITSKNLLNIVYNSKYNCFYVGSKDKGIYEIKLDKTIQYQSFKNKSVIDFEEINNQKIVLNQDGISFLDSKNTITKNITSAEFKKFETQYIANRKNKLPTHNDGYYELDYKIAAKDIKYYEIVKNQQSIWITSNIGIFEFNFDGKFLNYLPIHSYKIGFTSDNKFIETIPYAGVRVYDNVYNLAGKHYSEFDKNTPKDIVKILNLNGKTYLTSIFDGLFTYQNNNFKSLAKQNIWKEQKLKFITKNDKGNLIISSELGSVFIINAANFKILDTITKDKIIGNTITFLESYKASIIIGTEKGITIYTNGKIQFIDKEQGLVDCHINTSQLFKNQLYLGTNKGYYTLDLDKFLSNNTTVSSLKISDISINSEPINSSNYKWFSFDSKELICDYQHNTISLNFIPKGHLFPKKLRFRYRLKSSNKWSPYSDKPTVFLSYLPDDNYNLEIEVLDLNTSKSTLFKVLKIIIKPPFYKTWWFFCLLLLLAVSLLILIIFRIKQKAKNKAITEKIIAKSKLEALLSQMNPHFTFNAMNAIQNYVFNNDEHNSAIYISEFASLMRQTLDNSAKQTISIEDEIAYLEKYIFIENMRFNNTIKYDIKVDEKIDSTFTEIPTMLVQPFVENIFVHAFTENSVQPYFSIDFCLVTDNEINIIIKDNGTNKRTTKKSHQSRGIDIAKERIKLLQDKNINPIEVQFSEIGTTVLLRWFI